MLGGGAVYDRMHRKKERKKRFNYLIILYKHEYFKHLCSYIYTSKMRHK